MIHSKLVLPRIFPWGSARSPEQIDRVINVTDDYTGNREKQYEFGREKVLGFKHNTPTNTYTMRQYEFGSMSLWRALANKTDPITGENSYIHLDDIKATKFDMALFTTDDNGFFTGTLYFPKLRVNSFSLNIGDPQAIIERNFNLVGEHYVSLDGNYLAYAETVVSGLGTGESTVDMVLSPAPIEISTGEYIIKVRRESANNVSELVEGASADYSFVHSTNTLTVRGCANADIIKVYYESATAYSTFWTNNDVDTDFLLAECAEVHMKVGLGSDSRIYRLQTVGIDGTFDRTDYREIGNAEVVQTGVRNTTVTVNLDRYAEGMTLEKILASNSAFPYYDPDTFSDHIQLMVKIYTDKTHETFSIGYLLTDLAPTAMNVNQAVQDYQKKTNRLESDNVLVSDLEADIVFA